MEIQHVGAFLHASIFATTKSAKFTQFPIAAALAIPSDARPVPYRLRIMSTPGHDASRPETDKTTRVPTGDLEHVKSALTETLVRKMRAKFARDGNTASQDIVGEEVVAFMSLVGSVKETEINALELRISSRLRGETTASGLPEEKQSSQEDQNLNRTKKPPTTNGRRFDPNGVKDEWAEISKWRSREGERMAAEALVKKRVDQRAMAEALALQTKAKDDKKLVELAEKKAYKIEEERRLEVWKREELAKVEKRTIATEKLKDERRAQMADKTSRLHAQILVKKEEDVALRKRLAAQYRKKMIEDAEKKTSVAIETEKLKQSNAETLLIREEHARKEATDDLMYQKLYAEKLAKQEADGLANIQAVKDKQNLLTAAMSGRGNEPLSERRYYDDATIARNAAAADFKAATRETLDLERAQTLAMNTKRALGEQIRAKQERLDRERVDAANKHKRFARVVDTLERVEKTSLADQRANRVAHLKQLEQQMRDNQLRKTVFPMTNTERALNSGLLAQVRGEH